MIMTKNKTKLARVVNENSRPISLKKRRLGLMKKVRELTILCDVKSCLIMFSPNETEPMVWPSVETARDLLDDFFALPEFEKKKNETTLESYLKEKIRKIHEQLMKGQKKKMEYAIDQLMVELSQDRRIADLSFNEIYVLLCFAKDNIMRLRKMLGLMQHPPLRNPPMHPFEEQSEELRTAKNEAFMLGCCQDAMKIVEGDKRFNIGTVRGNYLMDQWFLPSSEPPKPQIGMKMESYSQNGKPICYLPYQGSSSNGNPNLKMESIGPPVMILHDLVGSVSQRLVYHHHNMNTNPILVMNQPRQYPFDFRSLDERSNNNNGASQFHRTSNIMMTNDGLRQEPPPQNGRESNVGATSFDINRDWSGQHRF